MVDIGAQRRRKACGGSINMSLVGVVKGLGWRVFISEDLKDIKFVSGGQEEILSAI